jgi:predicted dehydrogenase
MAPTWGETLEIARIGDESGCLLTFCHQRRFAKGNIEARRLIESGRFGQLLRMDLCSPPNLLDCGTHTFDQALSFNRETPAKWALGAVDVTKTLNWFNVPSEGMFAGTLVFQNGVRANIQVGGPDVDMHTGVRVIGTEGFLEVAWDGQFGRGVVYAEPSWKPPVIEDKTENHMFGVVSNAIDCLASGAEPVLSYKKALRAAEIIFAMYESVRRHTRIELPLTGVTDNPFIAMLTAGEFARGTQAASAKG